MTYDTKDCLTDTLRERVVDQANDWVEYGALPHMEKHFDIIPDPAEGSPDYCDYINEEGILDGSLVLAQNRHNIDKAISLIAEYIWDIPKGNKPMELEVVMFDWIAWDDPTDQAELLARIGRKEQPE